MRGRGARGAASFFSLIGQNVHPVVDDIVNDKNMTIARYLIYIQGIILVISAVFIYSKIRRARIAQKVSLDPDLCNDNTLLDWAASQGIKGKVSIGNFVYEDLTGVKFSHCALIF
jgi:ABC-type xylose transport system permease subunit